MWSFLFFFLPPPLDWFTLAIEPASSSCFISTSSVGYQPLIVDFFISQSSNQVQQELEQERWWWMAAVQTLYGIIHQQSAGQQQQLAAVLCVWVYHLFRYIISHFSLSLSLVVVNSSIRLGPCRLHLLREKENDQHRVEFWVWVGKKVVAGCSRRVMKWDYARPSRSYA